MGPMDSEIQQYAGDILAHPRFQQLRTFCHHGLDNSVYDHSVAVAEAACQIARLMRLSESETTSVVRAALLHDFFGYDWHGERFRRYLSHLHGICFRWRPCRARESRGSSPWRIKPWRPRK